MPPQPLVTLRPGTLILLAVCHFAAFVDRSLPAVFAPALKQAFRLSDTQIGALQGPAFVAVFAIATLLAGTRHNRLGVRTLLVGCLALWTLASLAFACRPPMRPCWPHGCCWGLDRRPSHRLRFGF